MTQEPQQNILLQAELIDILPNPVLVKDDKLRYVLVNRAFEDLFSIRRGDIIGKLDTEIFKERQAAQCNGGDLRVLESGKMDEAFETVYRSDSEPRETITRKSRLSLPDGKVYIVGIMHDITEVSEINRQLEGNQRLLEQQSEALERMANSDPLTGCANRRSFTAKAPEKFIKHDNTGSLLLLDIDFFKRINDTYGHDTGDAVLVHFAEVVGEILRPEDDFVRLGGEEFAVVLPGVSPETALSRAEKIRKAVESTPLVHSGVPISITVSIGVVHSSSGEEFSLDTMMREGDRRLYVAKEDGRNRIAAA